MPRPPSVSVRKSARLRKKRIPAGAAGGVSSSLAKNLDMDILGALPLELSIRILKYLTPAESILLRLVSKSYHDLLTSEVVCSSLSHHFIKREYNATKKLDSWRLHYENHVSRRLAYGSGKPWGIERLPRMLHRSFCPETGCFAGVPEAERHTVQVLDLNKCPAEYVFPPTRTPDSSEILDVILLPSFVVALTRERGYSWNLETHQLYRFRVPDLYKTSSGNGNLIVIALEHSVIVHDVQAQEVSSFDDIGDNMRVWEGAEAAELEETYFSGMTFAIANEEKRAFWFFRELISQDFQDFFDLPVPVFAIDGVHLETGEPVVPREVRNIVARSRSYCGDGLWQFWGSQSFSCHPGPAQHATSAQAERFIFDTGTGAWTEEPYTIMFPGGLPEFDSHTRYSTRYPPPITRSDGLGCFTESHPHSGVWMLDREPGDRVARARPLALNPLANLSAYGGLPVHCFGLGDKFVLLGGGLYKVVVARFKGIHDSDRVGHEPRGKLEPARLAGGAGSSRLVSGKPGSSRIEPERKGFEIFEVPCPQPSTHNG